MAKVKFNMLEQKTINKYEKVCKKLENIQEREKIEIYALAIDYNYLTDNQQKIARDKLTKIGQKYNCTWKELTIWTFFNDYLEI